jgi:ribA/ribD-fused uncharacterized protein
MKVYSVAELTAEIASGKKFQYLFFWGHRVKPDGSAGSSCCSQWFPCGFQIEGVHYATAEHFMMAEKARLFGDMEILPEILSASTPALAKQAGRKVRNFQLEKWDQHCFEIVVKGNLAKFSQNRNLKDWLLSTSPVVLVEASPDDRIWGIGLVREDPRAQDPAKWQGRNLLGFALMRVRDLLAFQQETD